jgi:hypothetical protein
MIFWTGSGHGDFNSDVEVLRGFGRDARLLVAQDRDAAAARRGQVSEPHGFVS